VCAAGCTSATVAQYTFAWTQPPTSSSCSMLRQKQQECCASSLVSGLPAESTAAAAVLLSVELLHCPRRDGLISMTSRALCTCTGAFNAQACMVCPAQPQSCTCAVAGCSSCIHVLVSNVGREGCGVCLCVGVCRLVCMHCVSALVVVCMCRCTFSVEVHTHMMSVLAPLFLLWQCCCGRLCRHSLCSNCTLQWRVSQQA
jgi:hypothetical protein